MNEWNISCCPTLRTLTRRHLLRTFLLSYIVYADCHIDYSGDDVTPENFMNVLLGDSDKVGGKKVLEQNSDNNVFVYFVDHGANGLVAFPNEYLYADDLVNTLQQMHKNNAYNELVFYMEACESGSMFEKLPNDINIYATTASNADQSSWAAYCSPDDKVNGQEIGSCLGDLYSVNFLEDVENGDNIDNESVESDYETTKSETAAQSEVLEFGDLSIAQEGTHNFFASKDFHNPATDAFLSFRGASKVTEETTLRAKDSALVDSRDVQLHFLFNRYNRADLTKEEKDDAHMALMAELAHRAFVDDVFSTVTSRVVGPKSFEELSTKVNSFDCLRIVNKEFIDPHCGTYSDYSLKYVRNVVHMCETTVSLGYTEEEAGRLIGSEFKSHCSSSTM